MATATPWIGHSGKLRKRRRVYGWDKQVATDSESNKNTSPEEVNPGSITVTRRGCQINKLARFQVMYSPAQGLIKEKMGKM